MKALRVAVVQGGPSSEAEVSRSSASGVSRALEQAGHLVTRFELSAELPAALLAQRFDVVFPVVHGAVGEDGSLQGLLEVLALPYVGSGVLASATAMDKRTARILFASAGLPIARGLALARGDATACARRARAQIGGRLVVKPACSGSAIGVARLESTATEADVAAALEQAWALDGVAIVEHFAKGREVTCSVLDVNGKARALAATEIEAPSDAFYTYEARYAAGRSTHTCPALLGESLTARVHEVSLAAHTALGCRDLSRVDFVIGDEGQPDAVTLLEVNTMPGMTATSLYPEAAAACGMSFSALCDTLVQAARTRGVPARNAPVPLPT